MCKMQIQSAKLIPPPKKKSGECVLSVVEFSLCPFTSDQYQLKTF